MKKKLLQILSFGAAVLCGMFSVYGCQSTTPSEGSGQENNNPPIVTPQPKPEPEPEPEPPHKHNYVAKIKKDATCTEAGIKEYVCECGEVDREETITKLNHDWRKTVIKAATCTENGLDSFKCVRCNEKKEEVVLALNHDVKWNCDYSTHEGQCKNNDCKLVINKQLHSWLSDNTCADCGYELPYTDNLVYKLLPDGEEYSVNVPAALSKEDYKGQNCIVFPIYYNGLPVTEISEIDPWDSTQTKYPDNVSAIYVPETIKKIGQYAFNKFTGLTEITIADEPQIGRYAFRNTGYYNDESNWKDKILYLDKYILDADSTITSAEIKDGTKFICDGAFANMGQLRSVKIPASVKRIEDSAFYSTRLTDVYYGGTVEQWCGIDLSPSASVLYYGGGTGWEERYCSNFYINDKLVTDLVIPGTVKKVPAYAFYGCLSIVSVTMEEGVTEIGDYAFYGYKLKKISVPNSLEKLGDEALFSSSIVHNDEYEYTKYNNGYYIGNKSNPYLVLRWASAGSAKDPAKYFTVNSRTKFIHSGASTNTVNKLVSVTIPEGVVSIGESAFYGHEISSLTLPKSIKRIGKTAFAINKFNSVTIPKDVEEIGTLAFIGAKNIYYNGTFEQWCKASFGGDIMRWMTYGSQSFFNGTYGIAVDYNLYIDNKLIDSLTFPEEVDTIGAHTFAGTNVSKITIPQTVKTIGAAAFSRCKNLSEISMEKGVKFIEAGAFQACEKLVNVIIPDGVVRIGNNAFYNCAKLSSITLPNSLIELSGLSYCEALKDINYKGTQEQWEQINKVAGWNQGSEAYTIHFIEEE